MGTGPWSNEGAVSLVIIDSSGVFTGLFVYSPTPGAGKLIGSITNSPGSDPYGNSVLAGFTTYVAGSPYVAVNMASGEVAFYTASTYSGTYVVQAGMDVTGASFNELQFFANGGITLANPVTAIDASATDSTVISTDSANSLGTLGATGITITEATYYMLPFGPGGANMAFISVKGATSGSGPTAGSSTFATTLATEYRPATNTPLAVTTSPNVAGFFVTVGSGGGVALHYPTTGSGTNFACQGLYDLQ